MYLESVSGLELYLATRAVDGRGQSPLGFTAVQSRYTVSKPAACPFVGSQCPSPLHPQDEKYWSRRYKNNEAAKRSRDARRLKENQISVRAAFLEKENALLRQEVVAVRQELSHYRAVLSRYQAQHGTL